MLDFVFHNPVKIIFGKNKIEELGKELAPFGKKVLLVTGGGSVKKIGLYDQVIKQLRQAGVSYWEVSGVQPNPRLSLVYEGIEICKKQGIDFILGVGGGSAIDTGKAIAAGAKYSGDVWDFFEKKAEIMEALPLGAVLTLAATGTEMNGNTVISRWETNQKLGMGSPLLRPRFSILDPTCTFTVPREHTVNGIVDIMAHIFEQYFSPTPDIIIPDRIAESLLLSMIEIAPVVLAEPENYEARATMLWAGTLALNDLISMGKNTDWACHGIEHEVSAIYDIPHGAGLAIIFPNWMNYVLDAGVAKFVQYATRIWGVSAAGRPEREVALEGIRKTREFFTSLGAPAALSHYKIGAENIPLMASKAVHFGPIGGFKKLNGQDVEKILTACL